MASYDKIIFLDIDGALNGHALRRSRRGCTRTRSDPMSSSTMT